MSGHHLLGKVQQISTWAVVAGLGKLQQILALAIVGHSSEDSIEEGLGIHLKWSFAPNCLDLAYRLVLRPSRAFVDGCP